MTDDLDADRDAVKRVVRRWARAFSANDAEGVLAVWDSTYPHIIHQAEEFPDPIRGWDELRHYNTTMMKIASNLRDQAVADLEADILGDVGWVYLRGSITFDVAGMDEPICGEARQTFILRKRDNEWRVIHYHESRETPNLREPLRAAHPRAEELPRST